jgi:hypothetical protein
MDAAHSLFHVQGTLSNNRRHVFVVTVSKKRQNSIYGELYPKVTAIPRGNRISPDIDLLSVNENAQPPNAKISGWEVKLLRYRKTENDIPLDPFYSGLGQALCYFQHGIDRVLLVLGCYGAPKDQENKLLEKLTKVAKLTSTLVPKPSLGIELFTPELEGKRLLDPQPMDLGILGQSVFTHPWIDHAWANKRDNILFKHFAWGSRWVKDMSRLET